MSADKANFYTEKHLKEVERLRAVNTQLLEACKKIMAHECQECPCYVCYALAKDAIGASEKGETA